LKKENEMERKEQQRIYSRNWYAKNREGEAKKRKEYSKNPEHLKRNVELKSIRQKENRKEYNDYMREYMREKLNVKKHYINKMKIILNEEETYEIKLPETINASGFLELLNQFDNIVKLIRLNSIQKGFDNDKGIKTKRTYMSHMKNPFFDTREKVLDLLQYGYCGTQEDRERICKVTGKGWKEISKRFCQLIQRWDIKPNEVGLIKFGNKYQKSKNFGLPNYTIKSYTGVFDENGN